MLLRLNTHPVGAPSSRFAWIANLIANVAKMLAGPAPARAISPCRAEKPERQLVPPNRTNLTKATSMRRRGPCEAQGRLGRVAGRVVENDRSEVRC